jgi:hypothetical protein
MLQDMAYCAAASRVAIGGGSTIKLLDVGAEYGEVLNESTELPAGHVVNQLSWGQDGQVCRKQPHLRHVLWPRETAWCTPSGDHAFPCELIVNASMTQSDSRAAAGRQFCLQGVANNGLCWWLHRPPS